MRTFKTMERMKIIPAKNSNFAYDNDVGEMLYILNKGNFPIIDATFYDVENHPYILGYVVEGSVYEENGWYYGGFIVLDEDFDFQWANAECVADRVDEDTMHIETFMAVHYKKV